jgi:hypothetical protein
VNIFELLKLIRDNNGVAGEFTIVAESIMSLYMTEKIGSQTISKMFADIVRHMIMDSCLLAPKIRIQRKSQRL